MNKLMLRMTVLACLLCLGQRAMAQLAPRFVGLPELWAMAQTYDRQYLSALAQHEADKEIVKLARASLLPAVSATVQSGETRLQQVANNGTNLSPSAYQPLVATLRASVSLIDRERSLGVQVAQLQLDRAELLQKQIQGDLAFRLANAFYGELLAKETAELAKAQLDALTSQAERAARLFKGGVATRTDVEETASRMQLAKAQWQQSLSQVGLRRAALERIVGNLGESQLSPPPTGKSQSVIDAPLETMSARVSLVNPSVLAQRKAVELANAQLARANAAHLPTLSLSASRSAGREPSQSYRHEYQTAASLALNIPIYEGGRVLATSRQQMALLSKAQADLDTALQEAQYNLTEAYKTLADSAGQSAALALALNSAQVALDGMRIGQQAGLRTNTDVLNAEQQLFAVRRDILREELSGRLATLRLRLIMGESVSF